MSNQRFKGRNPFDRFNNKGRSSDKNSFTATWNATTSTTTSTNPNNPQHRKLLEPGDSGGKWTNPFEEDGGGGITSTRSKAGHATFRSSSSPTNSHLPRGTESTASGSSCNRSNIDTNSLIQSAARSVLDAKSFSSSPAKTPMSGDDDDNNSEYPAGAARAPTKTSARAAALSSLEKKPVPPMPDEQDRKRFIGCLAAVLASSYDYDTVDEYDDLSDAARNERLAYLDSVDDDWEPEIMPSGEKTNAEVEEEADSTMPTRSAAHDSFDSGDSEAIIDSMVATTSAISRAPSSSSSTRRPFAHQAASKELHRIRLSRSRHRKRRYDVLSRFLLDCTNYLMLEKMQAKAFLPMLTKLLVPQPAKNDPKLAGYQKLKLGTPIRLRRPASMNFGRSPSVSSSSNDVEDKPSPADDQILSEISKAAVDDFSAKAVDIFNQEVDEIEHLRPFLESMSLGGGFRCLALVMLQYLLHSKEGYDARVRNAMKRLGVILLVHEMLQDPSQIETDRIPPGNGERTDLVTLATRRFESLEHEIALRIITLSRNQQQGGRGRSDKQHGLRSAGTTDSQILRQEDVTRAGGGGISREQLIRGLKVGAVGVAAAGLFAVTGGLAAPGIAAGVAALASGTAATAAVAAVLTSTAAVTTIFGVGGGTLVAYKMNRRTQGVTEFEFRKETGNSSGEDGLALEAELFSTISISGWLRDFCDFQRPWGISPSNPWITDQVELLERFYAVHRPENVVKAERILESWEGEEKELWNLLRQKYGTDPDHLYPLADGPRQAGALTLEQKELLDLLVVELKLMPDPKRGSKNPMSRLRGKWGKQGQGKGGEDEAEAGSSEATPSRPSQPLHFDSIHDVPKKPSPRGTRSAAGASTVSSMGFESVSTVVAAPADGDDDENEEPEIPKHIATVWDYRSHYGGELYTIRWESELLKELCDSVADLAFDLVSGGTAQVLKHTAFAALMSAVAWPYALVNAANMIDGTWTLAVERADEAGRELARSLLFSRAGHRPVTLVGFSFGSRAIYACLKELARYQEKWCDYQEKLATTPDLDRKSTKGNEDDEVESIRNMREPASIVEDAILMGLPNHMSHTSWRACRQVVAGRLVNCFSQKDLILSLMFQFKRLKLKPVCGTCPVAVNGVENIDVTELVSGHERYCIVTGDLLKKVRHGEPFRSRPARLFKPDKLDETSSQASD